MPSSKTGAKESAMKVRHINGISDNACKCGSWLDHWLKFSGQPLLSYCSEEKCLQNPEVGAHVQKGGSFNDSWYIIPLCKAHNGKKGGAINVVDFVKLVSANVKETCGK
jgi:hypothetical protein